uniref:Uncharacterized protein n=1 Tax=Rhizophora mucronata TaxID=61149 RepID=A0A2P2QRS4_RHIMU
MWFSNTKAVLINKSWSSVHRITCFKLQKRSMG